MAGASAEFATMTYSGSGDVTAATTHVTDQGGAPGAGCEAADFAGYPPGTVALIQRGGCTFKIKATNAQAAGASAVVIYNNIDGALNGTLGSVGQNIPVIGTLQSIGAELVALLGSGPVTLRVATSTMSETRRPGTCSPTRRAVTRTASSCRARTSIRASRGRASTTTGRALRTTSSPRSRSRARTSAAQHDPVRVVGRRGVQPARLDVLRQRSLRREFGKIMMNLNHDMIASPNFVRFVYDGDGSDTPNAGPPGSAQIEQVFLNWFSSQGQATTPTAFDGRSDYGPFIARGAPAGGLFTGAEGIKTARRRGSTAA